jgi:hypothetical protein
MAGMLMRLCWKIRTSHDGYPRALNSRRFAFVMLVTKGAVSDPAPADSRTSGKSYSTHLRGVKTNHPQKEATNVYEV